jgi:ketosteroid isomerase-like protein
MQKRFILALGLVLSLILPEPATAAEEDPAHAELRALMKEFIATYNAGDLDKLMTYLDDHVVITWQNAHVDTSPQEVKAYVERMTKGPDRYVKKSTIAPEADALAKLYNDNRTAVAYGHSNDHYQLMNGTEFDQLTRWSTTLVKKDGRWKVVDVHISTNMFDNPILNLAVKMTAMWTGGIGAAAGLFVGIVGCWLVCRRKIAKNGP